MQALQRILRQIQQQLGRLPANAKLLVGSMMIIVLMALLLVSQYTGRQDMLPLGLASTSTDLRSDAARYLEGAGIRYEDRGGDIYVPADQRLSVLGRLNEQDIVSADQINFNSLIDLGSNLFMSEAQRRQAWMTATMNALEGMIAAHRNVDMVRIILQEPPGPRGLGPNIGPTASVSIRMRGEPMTQGFANAIGNMVAGAMPGLKIAEVRVTDLTTMKAFTPQTVEASANGYLEQQKRVEEHYQQRFEQFFAHVPGASITVTAVVRNTKETRRQTTLDDPKIAPSTAESRDFQAGGGAQGGVAGVNSNVAARINGGGRTTQVTESTTREQKDARFGGEESVIEDSTGYPLQINALIGIPRSYFVRMYQEQQGGAAGGEAAEPDVAALTAFVQQETDRYKRDLAPLISINALADAVPGEIIVREFHDFEFQFPVADQMGAGASGIASAGGGFFGLGGSMVKNIGLGALALASLLMMFIMVRKAGARMADDPANVPTVQGDMAELIGEAIEGEAPLEGFEVDDATMRTQQILKQINELVNSAPDEAAGLLERWIAADGVN